MSEGQLSAVQCVRCCTINQRVNKVCSKCGADLDDPKRAVVPTMTKEKTERSYENKSVDPIVSRLDSILGEESAIARNTRGIFWLIVLGYIVAFMGLVISLIVVL